MSGLCPKCGHPRTGSGDQCERCGVIFSRIRATEQPQLTGDVETLNREVASGDSHWLLPVKSGQPAVVTIIKAFFLLALAVWGVRLACQPIAGNAVGESFLHLINLPFHEAGHVFFTPLGRFMQILGGP